MSEVNNDFLEYGASFLVTKRDYDLYYSDPDSLLGAGGQRFIAPSNQMDQLLIVANGDIGIISKKGCYDYPMDSDKWFRNFSIINIGINIISTIISFIQWRGKVAEQNAKLDSYADKTYLAEAVERSRQQISSLNTTLIICLIIENVIGAAILFLLLPKLKKRYNEC